MRRAGSGRQGGAVMASADGVGWPGESRSPSAAPGGHGSRAESSGLGWPHKQAGDAPDEVRQTGADEEREAVAEAADERPGDEPPVRVRQALSAAVSRETRPAGKAAKNRTRGDEAVGGRPGGAAAVVTPAPGRSAMTAAEAALAAFGGPGREWPRPRSCRVITIANQKG